MKAAIVGIAGPALAAAERDIFAAHPPAGVILFARNVVDPAQLRALTGELRAVLPENAVLMVDQEGGRVARLRPPHWHGHPPSGALGALFARDAAAGLRAAWLTGALIGLDCAASGFDVACAPVLDRAVPGAHSVIGDRAFAADGCTIARLGRALADGLLAAGVQPVAKHVPGHGRAGADSHLELPVVRDADLEADLVPFALLADLPWAMTAHILYPVWDAEHPATLSPHILSAIVRGRIGFRGLIVSDDLAMKALAGAPADLGRAALAAGCDIALHCTGEAEATAALLAAVPRVTPSAAARLRAARTQAALRRRRLDADALAAERNALLPVA